MPHFGRASTFQLRTLTANLQRLFRRVVQRYDCTVIKGHRGQVEQDSAFERGRSKVRWPHGKHNAFPSRAADVAPYPVEWGGRLVDEDGKLNRENLNALLRFYHFAGYVQGVAEEMGIELRWGGDWDRDFELDDQTFNDLVHFEEVE